MKYFLGSLNGGYLLLAALAEKISISYFPLMPSLLTTVRTFVGFALFAQA